MKKFLNLLLILIVISSLFSTICLASEEIESDVIDEDYGISMEDLMSQETEEIKYVKAKIINKGEIVKEDQKVMQNCKVLLLEGEKSGTKLDAQVELGYEGYEEYMSDSFMMNEIVYVVVEQQENESGESMDIAYIVELDRQPQYIIIAILLIFILLIISFKNGLRILGLILYNILIISIGIVYLYFKELNQILSLSSIVVMLIIGDSMILNNFRKENLKETFVVIINSLISTIFGFVLLIGINKVLKLKGFVGNFDISALIMIIPAIGITVDVVIRSIKKAKEGKGFKLTVKDIFEKLPSKYNMVLLVWAGFFIENAVSMQSYLQESGYPFGFINFGSIAMELAKASIIILTPLIAIPVTVLTANEILKIKKTIPAPAEEK